MAQLPGQLRDAFYDCVEVLQAVETAVDFDGLRSGTWRLKPLGRRVKNYAGLWSLDLSPAWRLVVRFNRDGRRSRC